MPRQKELTIEEKLAGASPSVHRVTVCLNGALAAEVQRLDEELQQAVAQTMSDRLKLRKSAERIEELRAEMARYNQTFLIRGLPRPLNNKLKAEHPPRKDNQDDQLRGFNQDSFFVPLVRACIVEPELTDVQYEHMVNNISDGEFSKLALAAYGATEGGVDLPFSLTASALLRTSDETSKPQSA